jgi:hypothetical protein
MTCALVPFGSGCGTTAYPRGSGCEECVSESELDGATADDGTSAFTRLELVIVEGDDTDLHISSARSELAR